jgi:hypothetical protein
LRVTVQATGYHGRDLISQRLNYYDLPGDNYYCGAHGVKGTVKPLLRLLQGKGWTRAYQQAHKQHCPKHFDRMKLTGLPHMAGQPKFAFWAWPTRISMANEIVLTKMRYPAEGSWERLPEPFGASPDFNIHACIQFCSRIGVYIILQLSLPARITDTIVDVLFALEEITLKWHRKSDLPGKARRVREAFARCDAELPSQLATAVRHFLEHVFDTVVKHGCIERGGPFHVWSMLVAEQFNKTLKGLSEACKGVEEGLARGWGARYHMELDTLSRDPTLIDPPPYLRPGHEITLCGTSTSTDLPVCAS